MIILLACSLFGCGAPESTEINLAVANHPRVVLQEARANVVRLVLDPCDGGEPQSYEVNDEADLIRGAPIAVQPMDACAIGVELVDDPFDGGLWLQGQTDGNSKQAEGPTGLDLALDPGFVAYEGDVDVNTGSEGVLVLDLAVLFAGDVGVDELEALGSDVALAPGDAEAEALAEGVAPALRWFSSEGEASDVYLDLWPDIDVTVSANIEGNGCHRGPRPDKKPEPIPESAFESDADVDADTDTDTDSDTDVDVDVDADTDADSDAGPSSGSGGCGGGSSSSSGGGCGGGDGGSSSSSGCGEACAGDGGSSTSSDCGVSCNMSAAWIVFLSGITLRRRKDRGRRVA